MRTRRLGPFSVSAVGMGCMNLSHAYGVPPDRKTAERVLLRAFDLGYTLFDTAALYGFGANESLVGEVLAGRRDEIVLASKAGMFKNAQGRREIDGRPDAIARTCDEALARLRVETIDLYYLHRWDKRVPIEDSVGAMADLARAGKIRAVGLSEVSAATLRRAHAVHPIAAVQSEYSLWVRNPEIAVLEACRAIGATFVAFSPLGRGFLTGTLREVDTLAPQDIRRAMPRFQPDNFARNLPLLDTLSGIAAEQGCTMAQLALAWVLAQDQSIVALPGTTRLDHLEENAGAAPVRLTDQTLAALDRLFAPGTVHGDRYNAATQAEIDTEG